MIINSRFYQQSLARYTSEILSRDYQLMVGVFYFFEEIKILSFN